MDLEYVNDIPDIPVPPGPVPRFVHQSRLTFAFAQNNPLILEWTMEGRYEVVMTSPTHHEDVVAAEEVEEVEAARPEMISIAVMNGIVITTSDLLAMTSTEEEVGVGEDVVVVAEEEGSMIGTITLETTLEDRR